MAASINKIVFVTVGTTSFDKLIKTLCNSKLHSILKKHGYNQLMLQIGNGEFEPELITVDDFTLEYYRFKDSISEDIKNASLVISHAGAGSVLEVLEFNKPLIVVINEDLMGNHQLEIAYQLHKEKHLFYSSCSNLPQLLASLDLSLLKPYPPGHPEIFAHFVDDFMDFTKDDYLS